MRTMRSFEKELWAQWVLNRSKVEEDKSVRCPLLPMLYILKILGRMPFSRSETGLLNFRVLSLPVLWALSISSLEIYLVVRVFLWYRMRMGPSDDFDKTINTINELLFITTSFHGVLATWRSTPKITRAVNRWTTFLDLLETSTKRKLTSSVLDHSHIGVLVVFTVVSLIFISSYILVQRQTFFEVVVDAVYFVCIFYFNIFLWLWFVICIMVKRTAGLINDHLIKILTTNNTADDILALRRLWLELHACTTDLVDGIGPTLRMWRDLGFTINLFAFFGMFSLVFTRTYVDLHFLTISLIDTSLALFISYIASDSAHASVRSDVVYTIFTTRWTDLSEAVQSQLALLLDAVEMGKPCFEVRGFFTMDKACYLSVVRATITNLVVLTQFKVSTTKTTNH